VAGESQRNHDDAARNDANDHKQPKHIVHGPPPAAEREPLRLGFSFIRSQSVAPQEIAYNEIPHSFFMT
jgi:hypothetical protein